MQEIGIYIGTIKTLLMIVWFFTLFLKVNKRSKIQGENLSLS